MRSDNGQKEESTEARNKSMLPSPPAKAGQKKKSTHLTFRITLYLVKYQYTYIWIYICWHKISPYVSFHFAVGYRKRMTESDQLKTKWITSKRFQNLRHYEIPT